MFDTFSPVRFEVEGRVGLPLDSTARQLVRSVPSSAHKVVACRADSGEVLISLHGDGDG
jgi:hypothetical protein